MAISGKNGAVIKGGTTACVDSWTATNNIERLDATNTCSGGKRQWVEGINEWSGSFISHTYVGVAGSATLSLSNDDVTISGVALIDYTVDSPVQGSVVTHTYDFAFTGTVTVA